MRAFSRHRPGPSSPLAATGAWPLGSGFGALGQWVRPTTIGGGGVVVLLCLFARVMNEPLRQDEQIFFAAAMLLGEYDLYREVSFAHLPNLPLFLHGFLSVFGGDQAFMTARLFGFFCWVAFIPAFFMLCLELSKDLTTALLCVLLLVTNTLMVDYVSMVVTAHLLPICLATYGFLFFLQAMKDEQVSPWLMAISGAFLSLAVGTKANYIVVIPPFVVATLCLPRSMPIDRRLIRVVLPLAIGGLIAGLPTLYYLTMHTDVFLFNVLDFHLGPHRAYWSEPANAATVTGLTLGERLVFAYRLWGSGSTVLLLVTIAYFGSLVFFGGKEFLRGSDDRALVWPFFIALALTLLGTLICFAVKPSFPQYYMPPLPFAIMLIAALSGLLTQGQRPAARPFMTAIALSTLLIGGPMLMQDLPKLTSPDLWTGTRIHQTAAALRHQIDDNTDASAPVAALVPIYPLEAGLPVYPELASGPFYYRIGDYLSQEERERFRVTSPNTVGALLDHNPPGAVLVGHQGVLDDPLSAYAQEQGYLRVEAPIGADRYGESRLYLRRTGK